MKKIFVVVLIAGFFSCNDTNNKAEDSSGTEISTPSVSTDSAGARKDSTGAGLGADTTRARTNDADN